MRAGVGDEARFLADQAEDIGRVQADVPGLGDHLAAKRCREALRQVDFAARAFAGVDAAVPDGLRAGTVGGGKQLAVLHPAQAEVPLAHAFAAQSQCKRLQRSREARLGGGGRAFVRGQRGRQRRQGHRLAEVFAGQLAVEVHLAGQLLQRRQRLCELAFAGGGGRSRLAQRAGLPVAPGRVAPLVCAHVTDGALHGVPTLRTGAGAQGGARVPGECLVAPCGRGVAPFGHAPGGGVIGCRLGYQLHRRVAPGLRPGPGREILGQALLPALAQARRGHLGLVGRHAHKGQGRNLGLRSTADRGAGIEVQRRVLERLRHLRLHCRCHQRGGGAHGARPVDFSGAARLQPRILGAEDAGFDERRGQQLATVVEVALRKPGLEGARLVAGGKFLACRLGTQMLGEQGVAGDLAVVVHAKAREVAGEIGPVATRAELEQPVVAQPVFDVGAAPARIEGIELGLLRLGQAVAQVPVVDPLAQRMALGHGAFAQLRQPRAVLLLQRLTGLDGQIGRRLLRGDGHCAQPPQQCGEQRA